MKKGLRQGRGGSEAAARVKTVDLMKKGLRPPIDQNNGGPPRQNRRPDEEGIKTVIVTGAQNHKRQNRRPDEEGIKTISALS